MKSLSACSLLAASVFVACPAAAATTIALGSASGFALMGGTTITNTGSTTIAGDVGLVPGSSITGTGTISLVGDIHINNLLAMDAKASFTNAYDDAAGQSADFTYGGAYDLGGDVLGAGVHRSASSFLLNGVLTLDAAGDPNAVWIFQMGSTLITGSASSVTLLNDAQASHVFWQVGSSATLGASSLMVGSILADTSISLDAGAGVQGRLFANTGAITLIGNTINIPEPTTSVLLIGAAASALLIRRRNKPTVMAFV